MKKIVLLFLFFVYYQSNSQSNYQSEFTFDELLNITVASSSDFETIALNKGYQYDSFTDTYFYYVSNQQLIQLTKRIFTGDFFGIIYSTYSKENYLKIKNQMIERKFVFSKTVKISNTDLEGLLFNASNIYVTLYTKTTNLIPRYYISVMANLQDIK